MPPEGLRRARSAEGASEELLRTPGGDLPTGPRMQPLRVALVTAQQKCPNTPVERRWLAETSEGPGGLGCLFPLRVPDSIPGSSLFLTFSSPLKVRYFSSSPSWK